MPLVASENLFTPNPAKQNIVPVSNCDISDCVKDRTYACLDDVSIIKQFDNILDNNFQLIQAQDFVLEIKTILFGNSLRPRNIIRAFNPNSITGKIAFQLHAHKSYQGAVNTA